MSRSICHALGLAICLALASPPLAAFEATQGSMAKPSDGDLKDRIEHRLATNAVVKKYDVDVTVTSGTATLTGTVATAAQKSEAGRLAKVTGIRKVENNVNPAVARTLADRAKAGMNKAGEAITDTWITTKVKWFLTGDDLLKGSDVDVSTTDHVVTLKGYVKSSAGQTRAVALAKGTDGVTKVVDQLKVTK
jgi:hyperosmotically inducible protein